MEYADVRDKIKSGDIIALTHKAWASLHDLQIQVVRIATESVYSHVCVAWVVGGRVFVIEAVEPLVRIFPLSNLKDEGFYWIATDKPMTEAELEFGLARVGLGKYSKLEAIQGQLQTLDIGKDELWMCAELTVAMRRLSGLDLGPKATPAAVVQEALEQGYTLQFVITNKDEE